MKNVSVKSISASTMNISTTMRDSYHLIRERVYQGSIDFIQIIAELRMEKATGTLEANLSHGGICRVRFREEQDIRYSQNTP